ncbi:MAG: glycosyltransferase family 2 protein [Clostridia bacterium]|nr:glycosyltransferase family 2 protein [Clostridia bacterium]
MKLISIIVPCYNEEEALPLYYEAMLPVLEQLKDMGADTQFVFVDDGSKDGTLKTMRALAARDPRCRYLSFSRNFGKEAAMFAGLQHAKGDYVAVMDADLQDPPDMLPTMLRIIEDPASEGLPADEPIDCVGTRRTTREGEPPIRSFFARCFYKLINKISRTEIVDGARDFRLMTRRMVDAILSMSEYNRFSKGIFSWVGFRTHWLEYVNRERVAGQTKWSFHKLFLYSIDGITAFSTAPLAVASYTGLGICAVSFIGLLFVFIRALVHGDPVAGWPSLVCIILFLGGIQLLCIGVLGQYLAKTYLEVKGRPQYILQEDSTGDSSCCAEGKRN